MVVPTIICCLVTNSSRLRRNLYQDLRAPVQKCLDGAQEGQSVARPDHDIPWLVFNHSFFK
jgi:hypothetical protein